MQTTMAPTERKGIEYFPCVSEIKEMNETLYQIGGYLNFKNNQDLGRDITRDGAFRKTLQAAFARKSKGDPYLYPYLWNHSTDTPPIAGIFDADEDKSGLYTRVQFNPEIELARDVFSSYRRGMLRQQSMGYVAESVNWIRGDDGKGSVRELLGVDLKEGSAVLFAMNPLSVVDSVKRSYWPGYSAKGDEAKEGRVLSAQTIAVLKKATDGITSHVEDMQAHMRAMRANSLAGFPVYQMSSDEPYDIASALSALTDELEGKEGRAISEANHIKIGQATENIMKHVKIIKGVVDEHQRLRDLTGIPRIASSSAEFDTKADDPLLAHLRELNASLDAPTGRSTLSKLEELNAQIGVDLALVAFIESQ